MEDIQRVDEILKLKIDLYNKLMHIDRNDITPAEVCIMFELSRDGAVLAWIDKKLYGDTNA